MKRLKLIIVLVVTLLAPAYSQADKIAGIWLTAEGDSQIQIFKSPNGKYSGKVVWMQENQDAKDDKNPNNNLKQQTILGLQVLNNFNFNESEKEWAEGTIYDPNDGKTYECYMWFDDNYETLNIKGFVLGIRFLGRETSWKREKEVRQLLK